MEHKLVRDEYQPTSFPPYRYFTECSCGFQCRLQTENAAHTQFDHHLMAKGLPAHFANLPKESVVEGWKPF